MLGTKFMKRLIISLMVTFGLSASAQTYYVGQFSGTDYGNTGIVNQAGQTMTRCCSPHSPPLW